MKALVLVDGTTKMPDTAREQLPTKRAHQRKYSIHVLILATLLLLIGAVFAFFMPLDSCGMCSGRGHEVLQPGPKPVTKACLDCYGMGGRTLWAMLSDW